MYHVLTYLLRALYTAIVQHFTSTDWYQQLLADDA